MKKITALLIVLLLVLSMLVSCGSGSASDGGYNGNYGENEPSKGESTGGGSDSDPSYAPDAEDYERKIIKTYNIELETKSYETARDAIMAAANSFGGYISDSSEKDTVTHNGKKDRYATFTVRVPSEKVDAFVAEISKNASVLSKKLSTQDITTSYYDLEAQLESLLEQQARIEKLMDEATNFNYLLQLEDKLTSIRTQINNINKQIQIYDKSVALSYVYITLDEVVEYTEIVEKDPTFGEKIAKAFVGTFKNFANFAEALIVGIVWLLPVIIILGIAIPVVIVIARRYDKKQREKIEAERKAREQNK